MSFSPSAKEFQHVLTLSVMCNVSKTLWLQMRACVRAARSIQATVDAGKRNFKWPLFVVNFVHRTPAFINVHEIVHIFLIDVLTTRSCATKKALLLCAHGCGNTWNACPFRAAAERSFWRGVKLNCIMLKCVNAWQCFGRAQLERLGVGGGGCSWGWRPLQCFVLSHVPVVQSPLC